MTTLLTVDEALDRIRAGRQIILVDDEDRENEGDLCMAAEKVTPEDINFMARFGRGLICLTVTGDRALRLGLSKMTERNESRFGTNFYVSIEAREGVTTGISAADRATTLRVAVAPGADATCIVSPGHVFPICARDGGVLARAGQTEGSVDLARLAGLEPAGAICEIMNDDGSMARMPDLERFAEQHQLGILTIAQLIEYRLKRERQVREVWKGRATPAGLRHEFDVRVFKSSVNATEFMVLSLGELRAATPTLVRMHTACLLGDGLDVDICGCGAAKRRALRLIEDAGGGVLVYIHPGHGEVERDLPQHLGGAARGGSVPAAVYRDYGLGAQVLLELGLSRIRLMTDNPKRLVGLRSFGLEVVERVPLIQN
jgi:3,4-dihydroxy 2-butanone 4-phosphate synthase / GTP cyclohydrolase II